MEQYINIFDILSNKSKRLLMKISNKIEKNNAFSLTKS